MSASPTPLLMLAAYRGRVETVQALARGADLDRRNDRDQSIVAGAPFKGDDGVVRALVAHGAGLDAGAPSRDAARMFGRTGLLQARE